MAIVKIKLSGNGFLPVELKHLLPSLTGTSLSPEIKFRQQNLFMLII
ncbi:MAG: hypothetical protein ABFR36_03530 [Acidobacteriota bacterium]